MPNSSGTAPSAPIGGHSELVPSGERDGIGEDERRHQAKVLPRRCRQRETRGHQGGREQPRRPAQRRLLGNRGAAERALYRFVFAKSVPTGSVTVKVALVADHPARCSPAHLFLSRECLEGIQIRNAIRKRRRIFGEPPGDHRRQTGHLVAAVGLPVSADLSRPAQRKPDRHHGEAGRDASEVSALPGGNYLEGDRIETVSIGRK